MNEQRSIHEVTAMSEAGPDKFRRDRDWTGAVPVASPEPAWEIKDKRFTGAQYDAPLQRIWHGIGSEAALWCEGPVWMGDWGCLLWSDIPNIGCCAGPRTTAT
jgi:gluconolactonase